MVNHGVSFPCSAADDRYALKQIVRCSLRSGNDAYSCKEHLLGFLPLFCPSFYAYKSSLICTYLGTFHHSSCDPGGNVRDRDRTGRHTANSMAAKRPHTVVATSIECDLDPATRARAPEKQSGNK